MDDTLTLTRDEADRLVLDLIARHAQSLLRVAQRYSYCADDAQDAYQRSMEILMRHAHRLDPARADRWLHTVVKREALAVRRSRARLVGVEEADLDRLEERTTESPEDRLLSAERIGRTAEALSKVKPDEARAIWLKAGGDSYAEIGERTGWSYTKVNRCLTEGRKSFLEHFAGIESGEACARWEPVLSQIVDGEAAAEIVVEARAHLRHCPSCRATLRRLRVANTSLAAVLPGAAGAGALHDDLVDAPVAAGGFAGRLWDAVVGFAHDRAAAGAVRAQAVIDAASSHKLAAVAASAAAVAGGGVAVEDAVRAERPVPRVTTRAAPPRTQPVRATPVHVAWRTASSPVRSEPVRSSTGRPATGTRRRSARASAARMRRVVRTSAQPAAIRTTAPPAVRAAPPPSEPLVDPVESPAAAPAQAATTPAVAPSRRSPSAATPSQPSAGTEFGFEAP